MIKRVLLVIIILVLSSLVWWSPIFAPNQSIAASIITTGSEFGIATDPPASFLNMNDMAPGDEVAADLNVLNTGQHDFNYTVSAAWEHGDLDLFNILNLELLDQSGTVRFSGSLSELAELDLGTIGPGEQALLKFKMIFPAGAGNYYQGKAAGVQFNFAARSHEGDIGTGTIFEPPIINNQFKLKIDSTVPIKFHLIRDDGSIDYSRHEQVILEVTGPDAQGAAITYRFRLDDGTLRFDDALEMPHYIAKFSTRNYPGQAEQWYTARVLEAGMELGSITFQADVAPDANRSNSP